MLEVVHERDRVNLYEVLRQMSDSESAGTFDRSGVVIQFAGDDSEECCFACTVRADEADTGIVRNLQVKPTKYNLFTE